MKKQRLYVGNLAWSTTSDELREHFARFGKIVDVSIPKDRELDRIKGFGFIEFGEPEDAIEAAREMAGSEFKGRPLKVDFATGRQ